MGVTMINRKKRTNNKSKMARYNKQARAGMLGFILSWNESDPFAGDNEIINTGVSHTNAHQRLIVGEMWRSCAHWITNTEFTWLVQMQVSYETENRGVKLDDYELTFTCAIRGNKSEILEYAMIESFNESQAGNRALADGHKNKGIYIGCKFKAQIIGV